MAGFIPAARVVEEAVVEEVVPALEQSKAVTNVVHALEGFGKKALRAAENFNTTVSAAQNSQTVIDAAKAKLDELRPAHHAATERPAISPVPQPDHAKPTPAASLGHRQAESEPARAEPIAFGSTGPAVSQLQHQLGVHVDGIDGPDTTAALNAFKRAHGLQPDGVAGPATRAALAAEPMLREGSQGEAVRDVQERLGVRADGLDGAQTTAAVKAFQQSHGLTVDGIVGNHTWQALDAAAKTRASSDVEPRASDDPGLHIRYGSDERAVGSGFRQSGAIVSVADGVVTQSAGRSTVMYKLSELTAATPNAAAVEGLLVPGRQVQISIEPDGVHVTSIERGQHLDRADSGR